MPLRANTYMRAGSLVTELSKPPTRAVGAAVAPLVLTENVELLILVFPLNPVMLCVLDVAWLAPSDLLPHLSRVLSESFKIKLVPLASTFDAM